MYYIADWNVLGNCSIQTELLKMIIKSENSSNSQIFSFLNKLKNNDIALSQELLNNVTHHFSKQDYKLAYSFIKQFDSVLYNRTLYKILNKLGRDEFWRRDLKLTSSIWEIIRNRNIGYRTLKRMNEACARTGDITTLGLIADLLNTKKHLNTSRMYLSLLCSLSSKNVHDPHLAVKVWLESPRIVKENPESVLHVINSIPTRESFTRHFPMICKSLLTQSGGLAVDNLAEFVRVGIPFNEDCTELRKAVFEACANYLKSLNGVMDGNDIMKAVDELASEKCLDRLFDDRLDNGDKCEIKIDNLKCVGDVVMQYYEDKPKDEVIENAITDLERLIKE
jgi:hypothetical protein